MREPTESLVLSACLGALIGLIRQWEVQQESTREPEFAGVRTFTLVALLGCVAAFVGDTHSPGTFAVTLGVIGISMAATQFIRTGDRPAGYTTPAATLGTFFVGALVVWQERQGAALLAAFTMLLLGLKQPIHQWTRKFTNHDIRSTLQFVAITGLILPLVPNRNLGPYGGFNPYSTWLMVVLISGIGFLGYILMRLLGSQVGITLTGLVGGLASSTATTLAFSRRSRENPEDSDNCTLAVVLACNVMLARVLVVAAAIDLAFARRLLPALLMMAFPGIAFAAWMAIGRRKSRETVEAPAVTNPLSFATSLKFALLYAGVKLMLRAAGELGIDRGIVAISAFGGLTDVDAIAVSLSESARDRTLDGSLAVTALLAGCASNSIVKAALGASLGSPALRRRLVGVLGATAVAGIAGMFVF
jgi:uncharacterized membrane protein (DUF4010 family)